MMKIGLPLRIYMLRHCKLFKIFSDFYTALQIKLGNLNSVTEICKIIISRIARYSDRCNL